MLEIHDSDRPDVTTTIGDSAVQLPEGEGLVIGLGQFKFSGFPELGSNFEIPLFCFIVTKSEESNEYLATCIDLQIDGYGHNSAQKAISTMFSNVRYFLLNCFNEKKHVDDAWGNILTLLKSNPEVNHLWDAYNEMKINFARKGTSIDLYSKMCKEIKALKKLNKDFKEQLQQLGVDPETLERYEYTECA
ncbi:MAG: hypothetical protein LBI42_03470 [Chitinispirillales bacterium]|jgi:hypothetical protein|nr:hypothetical protein [Chitinispirillales bacterium]